MKRSLLLFCSTLFIAYSAFAQPSVKQWDYRYGGSGDDFLNGFQETADGGFILGGLSQSGLTGDKTDTSRGAEDYWVVKLDVNGIKVWDKTFGAPGQDVMNTLLQTSDGGYLLGGLSRSGIGGDKTQACYGEDDYWIVKIDALGNKQWDRTIGGDSNDVCSVIKQTTDGGYILGGHSISNISNDKTQACRGRVDYWIVKTDSLGNIQWDKTYGGTEADRVHSLQQTPDGGYIIAGDSRSGIGGEKTQVVYGGTDFWMVKVDSLGNFQWDQTYGGTGADYGNGIEITPDGGYLIGGESASNNNGNKLTPRKGAADYWIIKTDSLGVRQWENVYGAAQTEEFYNFHATSDGGYLLLGDSYSMLAGGDKTEPNLGQEQIWVVKIDSAGTKLWDKTMLTNGHDEGAFGVQAKDGCYVFSGMSAAGIAGYKTQGSQGSYDFWLIKFCDSTTAALPVAHFVSSDTSFCDEAGKCIDFSDYSIGNPASWTWLFPGATPSFSNQQNPTSICYNTPGTYAVTLIVTNSAGSDTLAVSPMITVGGTPPAPTVINVNDTLYCSHASSYQWYYNGVPINGATDSSYYASNYGSYNVEITDSLGCSRLGSSVVAAVNEFMAYGLQFTVYPNPARDKFTVYGLPDSYRDVTTLEIYNVLGEKVYSDVFKSKQ